jgi:hypothetical protein
MHHRRVMLVLQALVAALIQSPLPTGTTGRIIEDMFD